MGLKLKNSARLAVSAGLCASLVMGGMPLNAIADELGVEKIDEAAAAAVEQNTAADQVAADQGDADHTVADQAGGQDAPETSDAPASDAASDAEPAAAEAVAPETEAASLAGEGTAEDPYQVATADDLRFVADRVINGEGNYASASYKLTDNIDLENGAWTPIGDIDHKFVGTFDGNGKVISNLKAEDPNSQYVGLFGVINSPAKLMNITVENATVMGKAQVGVIAGSAFTGTVSNCTVKGSINVVGNYKVGGIAGEGYAALENCHVKATGAVTGNYSGSNFEGDNVGGLIGYRGEGATPTTNCSVSGIKVSGTRKVGGLIGSAFTNNQVEECSVSGVAIACNATYEYGTNFLNSSSMGCGGLIGLYTSYENMGTLKNCSVSNINLTVENEQLAATNKVTLGYVSGGQRGNKAPDAAVETSGITVSGTNTGSNAEQKFPGSAAMNGTSNVFSQGSGTAEDPYILSSIDDLKLLQKTVNTTGLTYEDKYLKLADGAEFDLSGEKWTSIGTSSHKFMGTFDGNGATIKGLTDGGTYGTYGLFGYISGATIKNMKFTDVKFEYKSLNRGAVAGYLYGTNTIENIEVSGSIAGNDYVGGIAGRPYVDDKNPGTLTIKNCVNNATISGNTKVGGIVGYARADVAGSTLCVVESCTNNGAVSGQYAGGIAGWAWNANLKDCANTAKVSGTISAGGIVGSTNGNTKIDVCKNSGEIVMNGSADALTGAGGIIGVSNSGGVEVTKSANTGSVTAAKSAGGIIGGTGAAGDTVVNCYNGGAISATEKDAVAAGIYGYNNSTSPVKACFNDGAIAAENGTVYQIGLSNYWYDQATGSKIASCYYLGDDGLIYAAAENGKDSGALQKDMTRGELAETLNTAGGVENFWQAQNGSVQPDPLVPGAWDDEGKVTVEVCDANGDVAERYDSLSDALAAAQDGQTVKLLKDIKSDDVISITGAASVFDLNGHTISNGENLTTKLIDIASGVDMTITDSASNKGSITGTANATMVVVNAGATVKTENVVINFNDSNHSASNTAIKNEGTLVIGAGTKISSTEGGVWANGQKAVTTIDAGEITAAFYAVTGNGTGSGTKITVNGGKLVATDGVGIYHPQAGELILNGGEITGHTGVQMCAGTLTVPETSAVKVSATGTDDRANKEENDGNIGDGSAISIVNRNYPGGIPSVNIKGGSFSSKNGEVVLAYTWSDSTKKHEEWEKAAEHVEVSGGAYNKQVPVAYLAEGFGLNELPGGGYGVHEHVWSDKFESNKDGHWHACTKCDEKTEVVAHVEKTVGAKKATCGEDGYTGDTVCADCGYVIKKGSVIPATGKHAAGETWKANDTSHWHECEDCGAKLDEAKHTSSEWVVNNTDHWHLCDVCGAAFDVSAHDFGEWKVTKEATATEAGSREHTCKTCGKVVRESIPALTGTDVKPGKGDKLAQTGDTSLFAAAAAGIAGISTALAGVFTSRKKRDNK